MASLATILPLVLVTVRSISTKGVMPSRTPIMQRRVQPAGLPKDRPRRVSTASVFDCQGAIRWEGVDGRRSIAAFPRMSAAAVIYNAELTSSRAVYHSLLETRKARQLFSVAMRRGRPQIASKLILTRIAFPGSTT